MMATSTAPAFKKDPLAVYTGLGEEDAFVKVLQARGVMSYARR
jgi:hypothetical protein